MSGGTFNYSQHVIRDIAEDIEHRLNRQGKEISKDRLWLSDDYYEKYPEEKFYEIYSKEVQEAMIKAVYVLKKAYIYAHRVDWFLAADDGEESFIKRLNKELQELENSEKLKPKSQKEGSV